MLATLALTAAAMGAAVSPCRLAQSGDTVSLAAFADSAARGAFGYVDAIVVWRDGVPFFSRTFPRNYDGVYPMKEPSGPFNYQDAMWHPFYRGGSLHTLQSVSKSVTSMVFGAAVRRGDIKSIDAPISAFLPQHAEAFRDERKRRITIRHLLTMTSGLSWPEGGGYGSDDDISGRLEHSTDWVTFVLARPMDAEPGSKWQYSDGGAALLAAVFQGATGQDLQDYAAAHLFAPLGIERFHWKRSLGGLTDSEGGLYLEPASLARLGQLMLDRGMSGSTRILDEDWVVASVRPVPPAPGAAPGKTGYGLLWWTVAPGVLDEPDAFFGWGYGGQYVLVLPRSRTVAVLNQWMFDGKEIQPFAFARRVAAAIASRP